MVASGGLDSTTLAYHLADGGYGLRLVSVDYGQRHRRELDFAVALAGRLDVPHDVIDLRAVGRLLAGSALTDAAVSVPDGHYTDATMRITVVPNRNALLLDIAVALAVAHGAGAVAFGAHSGDHAIYPDCREEFVQAFEYSARVANEGFVADGFQVLAPFLTWTKAEIVRRGAQLGVPFGDTWSCYRGEVAHCGTCGTCTERREAFVLAGVTDPTDYVER
ncbi:7-cyano-7-deazaguanine synthase QueC [Pseudofrankia sp. DC12]|uniref:7-cyano-7-deazaguanine synthase QueC n=1 Tax=Pseudofrankia sp. DC12 TaxID=683315 RepID=UPI0018DCB204|nr:7-cyano-7-deazaguanine synthase QueC [Pseudofrankia sp. DC12]